jgi:hypothetical protein
MSRIRSTLVNGLARKRRGKVAVVAGFSKRVTAPHSNDEAGERALPDPGAIVFGTGFALERGGWSSGSVRSWRVILLDSFMSPP